MLAAGQPSAEQSDGAEADALANFSQMLVHGLDADGRYDQRGAGAARRADGAEQVGPGEPPVALDPRTRAALGPDAIRKALCQEPEERCRRRRGDRRSRAKTHDAICANQICG
jgi:hypothetical protein